MVFNNYNSPVGNQVLGTQNFQGSINQQVERARSELAELVAEYAQNVDTLSSNERLNLKHLATLQAALCAKQPEKSVVGRLLNTMSGISAAANIVERLKDWVASAG